MRYKRILLKLSGDFFQGSKPYGLDFEAVRKMAREILTCKKKFSLEIAVIMGGGNIFRGRERPEWFDRIKADQIGFLSTLLNALALTGALKSLRQDSCLISAKEIEGIVSCINIEEAQAALREGEVVIFACGTGLPYFTNDTAAVLRALEIKADVLLKATKVPGVFTADPEKDPKAKKYNFLTYEEALEKHLEVMDAPAFALAQENKLTIVVFKWEKGALAKIVRGERLGTIVKRKR